MTPHRTTTTSSWPPAAKPDSAPGIRHLANSILTQLAMAASGLGVTHIPTVSVRQMQPPAPYRPLTDRADIVELSLVSRGGTQEPLAGQFLRIATRSFQDQQMHV